MIAIRLPSLLSILLALTAPASAALVSQWNFENPAALGDDTGPLNRDATSVVGTPAYSTNAKVGTGALSLNGQSLLALGTNSAASYTGTNFMDGFSVTAWVNIDANSPQGPQSAGNPAPYQRIFSKDLLGSTTFQGNSWGVGVDLDTTGVQQMLGTTYGRVDRVSVSASLLGAWHHFGYVFRTTGGVITAVDFYLDGALLSSQTTGTTGMAAPLAGDAFAIGALNYATNNNFQGFRGLMDDLRIYDHELSASEVSALAAVPEPASAALAGMTGLLLLRRRR